MNVVPIILSLPDAGRTTFVSVLRHRFVPHNYPNKRLWWKTVHGKTPKTATRGPVTDSDTQMMMRFRSIFLKSQADRVARIIMMKFRQSRPKPHIMTDTPRSTHSDRYSEEIKVRGRGHGPPRCAPQPLQDALSHSYLEEDAGFQARDL